MRVYIPSRVHAFAKNYRLPLGSTVGLIIVIVLLLLLRTYERSILAGVLGDNKANGQDYARLLSGDAETVLKQNNVPKPAEIASPGNPTASSAQATTNTSTGLTVSSGGSSPPPVAGDTGGSAVPPPSRPFSALITDFNLRYQVGPSECDTSTSGGMCMEYNFYGNVASRNGPGTVEHTVKWIGPETGQLKDSFDASAGDTFTQVLYSIHLSCDMPGGYIFRLYIVSPNESTSQDVPLIHNCYALMPGGP